MIRAAIFDPTTGVIAQICLADSLANVTAACSPGQSAIEVGADVDDVSHYVDGGNTVEYPTRPSSFHQWDAAGKAWHDARTVEQLRSAQVLLIDAAFERAAAALTVGYPSSERLTWPTQQAEALAWAADPNAPTPFLDGVAAARGITAADMRQRALDSVQAFMSASQWLVGTRQALLDRIQAAAAAAAIAAINWPA